MIFNPYETVNKYSMNVKAKYLDASSLTLCIYIFSYAQ